MCSSMWDNPPVRGPVSLLLTVALASSVGCSKGARLERLAEQAHASGWPATVGEATTELRRTLSDADQAFVQSTRKEDLGQFQDNLGVDIRNSFGLWNANRALLEDCARHEADPCSMEIIVALWEALQAERTRPQ